METYGAEWTQTSDIRLKTNIQDDSLGLDFICKLRPVTFNWKPSNEVPEELTTMYTKEGDTRNTKETIHGLIAQEVENVIPEVVLDGGEYKSVSYGNIVGLLIEAVKEQQEQINTLKQTVEELSTKLADCCS